MFYAKQIIFDLLFTNQIIDLNKSSGKTSIDNICIHPAFLNKRILAVIYHVLSVVIFTQYSLTIRGTDPQILLALFFKEINLLVVLYTSIKF